MEIKSIGVVSTLEDIQNGKGFLFQNLKGKKYWGVKTSDNQHSAVVMALEPSRPYDDVPGALLHHYPEHYHFFQYEAHACTLILHKGYFFRAADGSRSGVFFIRMKLINRFWQLGFRRKWTMMDPIR